MNIVVAVTGGIAAYKSVHLVRLLLKAGHEVSVVPTEDALRFVGLPTWEAISRRPVTTSVHEDVAQVRHVALSQSAELVIVAPATANTIAKMAAGLADDLVGTTLLATTAPIAVAPAMHAEMWRHPATQTNIATLRSRGVAILGPSEGELTGGDCGPGRMLEPEQIIAEALALIDSELPAAAGERDLEGLRVAISAGGTREPLDPVRFLGNRSSGRQGIALALAAADRGAEVVLVAANVDGAVLADAERHPLISVERVGAAAELGDAMRRASEDAAVIVMAAAVADYRPADVSDRKLTKDSGQLESIELVMNEDIVARLAARRRQGQIVVAFAAETPEDGEELLERARLKRERKGVDLLVVNEVGWDLGFESDANSVHVIGDGGAVVARASGTKRTVADDVWDVIADAMA